jgi:hypothetical protein
MRTHVAKVSPDSQAARRFTCNLPVIAWFPFSESDTVCGHLPAYLAAAVTKSTPRSLQVLVQGPSVTLVRRPTRWGAQASTRAE